MLLQNTHLGLGYLAEVEQYLVKAEELHEDFRCVCVGGQLLKNWRAAPVMTLLLCPPASGLGVQCLIVESWSSLARRGCKLAGF